MIPIRYSVYKDFGPGIGCREESAYMPKRYLYIVSALSSPLGEKGKTRWPMAFFSGRQNRQNI
jgi:hypothetical protein